jgi:hypothetical protein
MKTHSQNRSFCERISLWNVISCYGVTMIRLSWLKSNIPSGAVRRTWMRWRLILFHSAHDEQNPQMTDTFTCYVFITASGCACLRRHLSCASACKNCFLGWPYKNMCRFTLHCLVSVWYYLRLSNASSVLHHIMFGMKCVSLWLSASAMLETSLEDQN